MSFFFFFLYTVSWFSWIYRFMIFIKFRNFLDIISLGIISVLPTNPLSWTLIIAHSIFSLRFLGFLFCFIFVFLLYVLNFGIVSIRFSSKFIDFFVASDCYKSCPFHFIYFFIFSFNFFLISSIYIIVTLYFSLKILSTLSISNILICQPYHLCHQWISLHWLIIFFLYKLIFLLSHTSDRKFLLKNGHYKFYNVECCFLLLLLLCCCCRCCCSCLERASVGC